jgi:DNA mismatch endonuclease, patch repair protein
MQSNRSLGTKPEVMLAKLLRKKLIKSELPGSPDLVFSRKKLAVFLHGCFWHRCPQCNYELPTRNREFWAAKFERNRVRDGLAKQRLESMGWKVVVVWEHEIKEDPYGSAQRVKAFR